MSILGSEKHADLQTGVGLKGKSRREVVQVVVNAIDSEERNCNERLRLRPMMDTEGIGLLFPRRQECGSRSLGGGG
jgi:hypothetical protein